MSNSKTFFFGTERSKTENVSIEAYSNTFNEMYILIQQLFNGVEGMKQSKKQSLIEVV
jgi:hypothetical protein